MEESPARGSISAFRLLLGHRTAEDDAPCLSARRAPSSTAKTPRLLAGAAGKGRDMGWSSDPTLPGCGTRVHPHTESLELLISPGVQAEPGWH